jgi:hypothetical protein
MSKQAWGMVVLGITLLTLALFIGIQVKTLNTPISASKNADKDMVATTESMKVSELEEYIGTGISSDKVKTILKRTTKTTVVVENSSTSKLVVLGSDDDLRNPLYNGYTVKSRSQYLANLKNGISINGNPIDGSVYNGKIEEQENGMKYLYYKLVIKGKDQPSRSYTTDHKVEIANDVHYLELTREELQRQIGSINSTEYTCVEFHPIEPSLEGTFWTFGVDGHSLVDLDQRLNSTRTTKFIVEKTEGKKGTKKITYWKATGVPSSYQGATANSLDVYNVYDQGSYYPTMVVGSSFYNNIKANATDKYRFFYVDGLETTMYVNGSVVESQRLENLGKLINNDCVYLVSFKNIFSNGIREIYITNMGIAKGTILQKSGIELLQANIDSTRVGSLVGTNKVELIYRGNKSDIMKVDSLYYDKSSGFLIKIVLSSE